MRLFAGVRPKSRGAFAVPMRTMLTLVNAVLVNAGFLLAFLIRYGFTFPEYNFAPYKRSFLFLTAIYVLSAAGCGVYRRRFKSSWDLFKRVFSALFISTLLSVAFVYVFRVEWGAFPTSIFIISFFVNLLLVFAVSRRLLKAAKRIKKKVVVLGEEEIEDMMPRRPHVVKQKIHSIRELLGCRDLDEILICEKIRDDSDFSLLVYLVQKLKVEVVFSPSIYMELLPMRINGEGPVAYLNTFFGRKPDIEEFFMRVLDVVASMFILIISAPAIAVAGLLIKSTSSGPVFYKQERVGKDGKVFTLYKFRTMVKDAEKRVGPVLATRDDPRVTGVGRILRAMRLDELPQLFNVLRGDMSLVGPRPERPHFVRQHRVLRQMRLVVRPGITGLAQVRSLYDLKPKHKIKYDHLYIQRRSFLLNLYILAKTVPVIFSKKGW
ncbi:MAG: sugar transferase [Phycisphaerales bacterium]|nr:MAG: sugar transferase [Phycisphaerales bacterium]